MKLLSLQWFKSQKEKELEELKVEEQKIKNDILKRELATLPEEDSGLKQIQRPYRKIKLVNNLLTVVLTDGNILSKPNASVDDYNKARIVKEEKELFKIVTSSELIEEKRQIEEEVKKIEVIVKGLDVLKTSPEFIVEDNTVYFKGINRSLPPLLVEKLSELFINNKDVVGQTELTDEFVALKRFFLWCCLNPRAEVADSLYDFLQKNKMKITKQGFFVALRNVVNVEGGDSKYVDFITNSYHKIKAVWKKNPKSYWIHKNDEGEFNFSKKEFTEFNDLGNLNDLYLNLSETKENRYTDNYTRKFDIRIGKVVNMPKDRCNWSTQDCATAGLHFAGYTAPYVLCGNTTVFTLHNPMKVVGIGKEKGRCWEYLPFMTTTVDEADQIMNSGDFDFLQLDEKYALDELEQLEEKVKEGFVEETKKYNFNIPQISSQELRHIIHSLDDMKKSIQDRVNLV